MTADRGIKMSVFWCKSIKIMYALGHGVYRQPNYYDSKSLVVFKLTSCDSEDIDRYMHDAIRTMFIDLYLKFI